MRPTILKVEHLADRVLMSTQGGPLIELKHDDPDNAAVLRALEGLRGATGRTPFFVLALTEPNDQGGRDFIPTFRRALDENEETDW